MLLIAEVMESISRNVADILGWKEDKYGILLRNNRPIITKSNRMLVLFKKSVLSKQKFIGTTNFEMFTPWEEGKVLKKRIEKIIGDDVKINVIEEFNENNDLVYSATVSKEFEGHEEVMIESDSFEKEGLALVDVLFKYHGQGGIKECVLAGKM